MLKIFGKKWNLLFKIFSVFQECYIDAIQVYIIKDLRLHRRRFNNSEELESSERIVHV